MSLMAESSSCTIVPHRMNKRPVHRQPIFHNETLALCFEGDLLV